MPKRRNKQEKRQMMAVMICLFFLLSTTIGAIFANGLSQEDVSALQLNIQKLFAEQKANTFSAIFLKYLKYDILIWLGGCFCYGGVLSAGVLAFRGISLGYTTAILIRSYGGNGIVAAICSLFPQNLILLPVYFFMTWLALCFLLEQRKGVSGKGALKREAQKRWTEYSILFFGSAVLIAAASFLELHLSNVLLNWIAPLYQ